VQVVGKLDTTKNQTTVCFLGQTWIQLMIFVIYKMKLYTLSSSNIFFYVPILQHFNSHCLAC